MRANGARGRVHEWVYHILKSICPSPLDFAAILPVAENAVVVKLNNQFGVPLDVILRDQDGKADLEFLKHIPVGQTVSLESLPVSS